MTPSEIETAARRKYNSVSSSFYSSAEVYDLIYQAECEAARETKMLEAVTTITSTAGTQSYAYPSTDPDVEDVLEIKRVEYNGGALIPITFRDDDQVTFFSSNATDQGTPAYYYDWANTIYLRPIPDASSIQIRIYYYAMPAAVTTATQVIEMPALFHMSIVDFVAAEFAAKDQNFEMYNFYMGRWRNEHIPAMKNWTRKRRTGNQFRTVVNVDAQDTTNRGIL